MSTSVQAEDLLAEVIATVATEVVAGDQRRLGVMVEGFPAFSLTAFARTLADRRPGLRLSLLGFPEPDQMTVRDAQPNLELNFSPEIANTWRNDVDARSNVPQVIVVRGQVPKVNSLRTTSEPLLPDAVRAEIAKRGMSLHSKRGRDEFFKRIGRSDQFTIPMLVDFLAAVIALHDAGGSAALTAHEHAEVYRLGLLQDDDLLSQNGPQALGQKIRRNREMRERLRELSPEDRRLLFRAVGDSDSERSQAADGALRFSQTGRNDDLAGLSLSAMRSILSGGKKRPPKPARTIRGTFDELVVEALANVDTELGDRVLSRLEASIPDDPEEESDDSFKVDDVQYTPVRRTDVAAIRDCVERFTSGNSWGGVARAEHDDELHSAIKTVMADPERRSSFGPKPIAEILNRAIDQGLDGAGARDAWLDLVQKREDLLPSVGALVEHPLMAMVSSPALAEKVDEYLRAHQQFLELLDPLVRRIDERSHETAQGLAAQALALDIVYFVLRDEVQAMTTPLHPFHLWQCFGLRQLLMDNRGKFTEDEAALLLEVAKNPPSTAPYVLASPFLIPTIRDASFLIANGRMATLATFTPSTSRLLGTDGTKAIANIVSRFVRIVPHARYGLRITVLDPPVVTETVRQVVKGSRRDDERIAFPLHIRILRTRDTLEPSRSEADVLDELSQEVRDSGGSVTDSKSGTLDTISTILDADPCHIVVVFDVEGAGDYRIRVQDPPLINPLVVPRAYHYDELADKIDAVPAGSGLAFDAYRRLLHEFTQRDEADFIGRRSGATVSKDVLSRLARGALWTVLIDRGIEPTLNIPGCTRLDARTVGGRDVLTITAHRESVDPVAEDCLQAGGLVATPVAVDQMIDELPDFAGQGVLSLVRRNTDKGLVDPRRAAGIIGMLRAARWYRHHYSRSVLFPLDDPDAFPWASKGDDDDHADLFGVRREGDDLVVDVIEVKTYAAGVHPRVTESTIEGPSIVQIDSTIGVLRDLISSRDDAGLVAARRERLRDFVYRSAASRDLSPPARKEAFSLLEELFGDTQPVFRGILASVTIDPRSASVQPVPSGQGWKSPSDNRISAIELIEGGSTQVPIDAGSRTPTDVSPQPEGGRATISPEIVSPAVVGSSLNVLIGTTPSGTDVWWSPNLEPDPLKNFGIQISGVSGAGKTQLVRGIIRDLALRGLPILVFDYKNDYSSPDFSQSVGLDVYDVEQAGLPFNPLAFVANDRGLVRPAMVAHELAAILRRVFDLGAQQEAMLRTSIRTAYEEAGIPVDSHAHQQSDLAPAPSFDRVVEIIRAQPKSDALLNRVEPLFSLGLFRAGSETRTTLEAMLEQRVVLDLHSLPNDAIKSAVSEFLIVRIHGLLLRGAQPRRLTRLIVLDEAHRIAQNDQLGSLAREGRAFGVGLVVATQFVGDVPESIAGNLETKIFLQASAGDSVNVAKVLAGRSGEAQRVAQTALQLARHQALFKNQHVTGWTLVNTIPDHVRQLTGARQRPQSPMG